MRGWWEVIHFHLFYDSNNRYARLHKLWLNHGVSEEVTRNLESSPGEARTCRHLELFVTFLSRICHHGLGPSLKKKKFIDIKDIKICLDYVSI